MNFPFSVRRVLLGGNNITRLDSRSLQTFTRGRTWDDEWDAIAKKITYTKDFNQSADQLREIVKSGLLRFTDLRDNPERFFAAHRKVAEKSPELGPGFWIRFTVQYNLFAGTILGLASDEQLPILDEMQGKGQLGCFALTEKFAGVNSGLVVNTYT